MTRLSSLTWSLKPAGDDGFTITETLLAFAILALSLSVFVQSVGLAVTQSTSALRVASAELLAVRLAIEANASGSAETSADGFDEESGLLWRLDIEEHSVGEGSNARAKLTHVQVYGDAEKNHEVFSLKTVTLRED